MRPISGVSIAQNVTNAAAAGLSLRIANAFSIADLSAGVDIRDVYENDIPKSRSARKRASCERLSRSALHRAHQRHWSRLDPHPNSKSPHRGSESRLLRLGMFGTATFSSRTKKPIPSFRPTPFCTCMTAIGSIYLPATINSAAQRFVPEGCPRQRQEILSGIKPASRLSPRRFCSKQRGTSR